MAGERKDRLVGGDLLQLIAGSMAVGKGVNDIFDANIGTSTASNVRHAFEGQLPREQGEVARNAFNYISDQAQVDQFGGLVELSLGAALVVNAFRSVRRKRSGDPSDQS